MSRRYQNMCRYKDVIVYSVYEDGHPKADFKSNKQAAKDYAKSLKGKTTIRKSRTLEKLS